MNTLDLGYVNRLAPYKVWTENGMDFYIETDFGNLFKVGFMNDSSIWESGAYQFTINNEHNRPSPNDSKLKNKRIRGQVLDSGLIKSPIRASQRKWGVKKHKSMI